MSRLDLASDRLKTALDGLERALAARGHEAPADNSHDRVAELEAERERLLEKIAMLEEELAAQSSLTEEVESRLDGAIGEVRAALGRT